MPFTDDQLKRLKEDISNFQMAWDRDKQIAILARLEAAEKVCKEWAVIANLEHSCSMNELYKAWRKSAGREGK